MHETYVIRITYRKRDGTSLTRYVGVDEASGGYPYLSERIPASGLYNEGIGCGENRIGKMVDWAKNESRYFNPGRAEDFEGMPMVIEVCELTPGVCHREHTTFEDWRT